MYFYNVIKDLAKKNDIMLYVDMDGVIAAYDVGNPSDFLNKRPLMNNIKQIEDISKIENVEVYILSICRKDFQIDEKNQWLDKYAPFFKKENRNIISKETVSGYTSAEIKTNFLKEVKTNKQVILIDDDNMVLKDVRQNVEGIIVFQDSQLVD